MKPGFIFSAVFVVALCMALGLPQLSAVSPAYAENGQNNSEQQPAVALRVAPPAVDGQPAVLQASPTQPAASGPASIAPLESADNIPLTSVSRTAPDLQNFINAVVNNQPGQIVGVYVPGLFALPILQQPSNDQNYISPFDGVLTQYAPPFDHGTISLLAHNYLAGRVFFNMQQGDAITLIYGDGRLENYRVSIIDHYQALSPLDPYSDFIDQSDPTGTVQSFQQVYDRYYTVSGQLVFQTCVEKNGDLSWGRIFVVAQPDF